MVADQFILSNDLSPDYRGEIVDFILRNSDIYVPASDYYRASVYNLEGIRKKLTEFAQTDRQREEILGLFNQNSGSALLESPRSALLESMLEWPQPQLFPVLDLIRVLMIRQPKVEEIPLSVLVKTLSSVVGDHRINSLMKMRVLVNMFGYSDHSDQLLVQGVNDNIAFARGLLQFKEPELLFGLLHKYIGISITLSCSSYAILGAKERLISKELIRDALLEVITLFKCSINIVDSQILYRMFFGPKDKISSLINCYHPPRTA